LGTISEYGSSTNNDHTTYQLLQHQLYGNDYHGQEEQQNRQPVDAVHIFCPFGEGFVRIPFFEIEVFGHLFQNAHKLIFGKSSEYPTAPRILLNIFGTIAFGRKQGCANGINWAGLENLFTIFFGPGGCIAWQRHWRRP
jgi:hypothetical protein